MASETVTGMPAFRRYRDGLVTTAEHPQLDHDHPAGQICGPCEALWQGSMGRGNSGKIVVNVKQSIPPFCQCPIPTIGPSGLCSTCGDWERPVEKGGCVSPPSLKTLYCISHNHFFVLGDTWSYCSGDRNIHHCLKHNIEYGPLQECAGCVAEQGNPSCTYCGHPHEIHTQYECRYIDSEGPCDCKVPTDRIYRPENPAGEPVLSGHPAFYRHLDRLRSLHSQKAQAYEGKSGYYANYRRFDKWSEVIAKHPKLAGFCYSMLRLEEKFERIRNILEGSLAGDEPVVENLDDMAVISVIARILYEEANENRD
mgnify:CR=1 FL=1